MQKYGVLRVVAAAMVAAVVVALGIALIDPARSRTAEHRERPHALALPHGVGPPRTIVMVVFDELPLTSLMGPGDRIDASRYPAFGRLARDATWYRGATAVHDSTALAVPAILDGRYPRAGTRSDVYSHPANLFTLLAHSYELHVSEEATGLCPTSMCEPQAGNTMSHLAGGKVERFDRFVRGVRPTPRPALWFKHVLLPHVPWQYYPSGRKYRRHAPEPIPGLNGELGFGVPWLVKVSYQRHLLQLGLADRLLGELLARLRKFGLYKDALVVVVADHGIGFHTGMDRRAVEPENVEDLAPVPLLVKLPGARRGTVVDRHVETVDVLPTILDLAGLESPRTLDGQSLLSPSAAQARHVRIYHRVEHQLNTVGGRYSFRPAELERLRQAALERKLELFGSGGGRSADALYRIGPYPGVIGRPLTSLLRVRGRATARIDQAADLLAVDPSSPFVPGELTGEVPDGRPGGGRTTAVALNGTIAATGRTFSLEGSRAESFEVIVPENSFRRGANEVRVFEIVRRGGSLALRRL